LQGDYDAVILGHCHVPSINRYTIAEKKKTLLRWATGLIIILFSIMKIIIFFSDITSGAFYNPQRDSNINYK